MPNKDRFLPVEPGEFEDDEPVDIDPVEVYQKGSTADTIKPLLIALIPVYAKPEKRTEIEAFIRWVPGMNLEMFLVHCMEYGAEKCHPTRKTRRKVAGKPATAKIAPLPPLPADEPPSGIQVGALDGPPPPEAPVGGP